SDSSADRPHRGRCARSYASAGRPRRGGRGRTDGYPTTGCGNRARMIHAIVLIQAERSALATLGGELADIEGVAEAYSVTGEWDFVAILRVREQDQVAQVVTGRLAGLPGVTRTQTLVAF